MPITTTTRVSVATDGTQANDRSLAPAISENGRYVAYYSFGTNLVNGDTNARADIFLKDLDTGSNTLVSGGLNGAQANNASFDPTVSADGRYVVFRSNASNLVSGDTNNQGDVFIRDVLTGATSIASLASNGSQGNGGSLDPIITPNGRYVAFASDASNLATGDTNSVRDAFVRDLQTGTTTLISQSSNGTIGNGFSQGTRVTPDGRYVVFESDATNLVANNTNAKRDVFLRDLQTGTTTLISIAPNGSIGNNVSFLPSISSDGRYVTFSSSANNLVSGDTNGQLDVFVRDLVTNTTSLVSTAPNGVASNNSSSEPAISSDGRYISFSSSASNLVSGDTNATQDIFVRNLLTGTTTRLSLAGDGTQGNGISSRSVISGDGKVVAFTSDATNLVSNDTNTQSDIFARPLVANSAPTDLSLSPTNVNENVPVNTVVGTLTTVDPDANETFTYSLVSGTGSTDNANFSIVNNQLRINVSPNYETKNSYSIRIRSTDPGGLSYEEPVTIAVNDLNEGGLITLVSVSSNGTQGNLLSDSPSISGNGQLVAFSSSSPNLVNGDSNDLIDLFVRDTLTGTTSLLSVSTNGIQGNAPSFSPSFSANGRYVAFISAANNLVDNDINGFPDIFVRDLLTGTTSLASIGTGGAQGNSVSGGIQDLVRQNISISNDGRFVAFNSYASNLVPNDTNGIYDVFVRDRLLGTTIRATVNDSGVQAGGYFPSLSDDGRYIAFVSNADNLVSGYTNNGLDRIYLRDLVGNTTTLISVGTGVGNDSNSSAPSISGSGRYVAFTSNSSNLVSNDTNGWSDVFVRDTLTNTTSLVSSSINGGSGNERSGEPYLAPGISDDGRYIAFVSRASDLVYGDTNGSTDVFVKDMQTGNTTLVPVGISNTPANGHSFALSLSSDGHRIAFASNATNLFTGITDANSNQADVFLRTI